MRLDEWQRFIESQFVEGEKIQQVKDEVAANIAPQQSNLAANGSYLENDKEPGSQGSAKSKDEPNFNATSVGSPSSVVASFGSPSVGHAVVKGAGASLGEAIVDVNVNSVKKPSGQKLGAKIDDGGGPDKQDAAIGKWGDAADQNGSTGHNELYESATPNQPPLPDAYKAPKPGPPRSRSHHVFTFAEITAEERNLLQAPLDTVDPNDSACGADPLPLAPTNRGLTYSPLDELQTEIPEFGAYLPKGLSTAPRMKPSQLDKDPDQAPRSAEPAPFSVIVPMTSGFVASSPAPPIKSPNGSATSQSDDRRHTAAPTEDANRLKRKSKKPSAEAHSFASELKAAIPHHMWMLLNWKGDGESEDVAQRSYKRPFQETRAQLIERLLDPILTLEEAARLLNVCPTTVRRYTNRGILTYYRKDPEKAIKAARGTGSRDINQEYVSKDQDKETRQRRFRLSDIVAFIESQRTMIESDRQLEAGLKFEGD